MSLAVAGRAEEVELDESESAWKITLGWVDPSVQRDSLIGGVLGSVRPPRVYKTFVVDANSGQVRAMDERRVSSFKRTRAYSAADYRRMITFMAQYRQLIVTPHILAEATNLLDQLSGPVRNAAFDLLRTLLNHSQTEERYEASAELAKRPEFPRLGLADTAVHSVVGIGSSPAHG